jgi:hypothetical protein
VVVAEKNANDDDNDDDNEGGEVSGDTGGTEGSVVVVEDGGVSEVVEVAVVAGGVGAVESWIGDGGIGAVSISTLGEPCIIERKRWRMGQYEYGSKLPFGYTRIDELREVLQRRKLVRCISGNSTGQPHVYISLRKDKRGGVVIVWRRGHILVRVPSAAVPDGDFYEVLDAMRLAWDAQGMLYARMQALAIERTSEFAYVLLYHQRCTRTTDYEPDVRSCTAEFVPPSSLRALYEQVCDSVALPQSTSG